MQVTSRTASPLNEKGSAVQFTYPAPTLRLPDFIIGRRGRQRSFGPGETKSGHDCLAIVGILLRVNVDSPNDGFNGCSHDDSSGRLTQLTRKLQYERV